MSDLDNLELLSDFDKNEVYPSLTLFAEQIKQAYREVKEIKIPKSFLNAKNIVIAGMGGSALGGRIIDSLIPQRVRVPIEVFTEFYIPNYVNSDSLVIVSSYSGNTQETIKDLYEAIKRGAKIFVVTAGGKLKTIATEEKIPGYFFEPKANPSGQPRLALGYSITAILAFLAECNYIHLTEEEIESVIAFTEEKIKEYGREESEDSNLAKKLAEEIKGKVPVFVASEHLIGSAHAFKNQLNETAKTFSVLFDIPELNHHLMEGLKNPTRLKELLKFIFIESKFYSPEVRKRYPLTLEVVEKNNYPTLSLEMIGKASLVQAFELVILSYFTAYYLAFLYGEDPSQIPWVSYFKEKIESEE